VQGEGGFIPMPPDFPARLKHLCERHGILYVDDEIQAGVGRTGPVWAIEHYGVAPDLLVSGKSLGGGLPLAAVTGRSKLMDAVEPGGLGGTFGGNPAACAAALAVLHEVASGELRRRADEIGRRMRERLARIAARVDAVGDVRGLGPMQALELVEDRTTQVPASQTARTTVTEARRRGLIVLTCGLHGNVVRLLPPLVVSDAELDQGLDILEEALLAAQPETNGGRS
jgi:4-aminobutyrate aminotransferase-like enzyme